MEKNKDSLVRLATYVFIGLLVVALASGCYFSIKPGETGILKTLNKPSETPLEEGPHLKIPFVQSVVKVNIQEQKMGVSATAATSDKQDVTVKLVINYRISKSDVVKLYREVGSDFADKIIVPALQSDTKASTTKYNAYGLLDNRSRVEKEINERLALRGLPTKGIYITNVYIDNLEFSPEFSKAIEDAALSLQNKIKDENERERNRIQAEQQIIKAEADKRSKVLAAEGEADALLARQTAEAKGYQLQAEAQAAGKRAIAEAEAYALQLQKQELNPAILELRRIEATKELYTHWSGDVPSVYMGGSSGTLIQLPQELVAAATQNKTG